MIFSDIYEFFKYLNENNLVINENINIELNPIKSQSQDIEENLNIRFSNLSESPTLKASVLGENILYVEDFSCIPELCGSGKIKMFGREIIANICNDNDVSSITMPIDLNENYHYNVKFQLKLLSQKPDNHSIVNLTEELIHAHKISVSDNRGSNFTETM